MAAPAFRSGMLTQGIWFLAPGGALEALNRRAILADERFWCGYRQGS